MREITVPAQRTFTRSDLIPVVARGRATSTPRAVPFEHHGDGQWRSVSNAELVRRVDTIAAGLIAAGVEPGDRVALMAGTRLEWVLVDLAVWTAGAITVPIYPSSSAGQLEWILADSAAKVLVAENEAHVVVVGDATVPDTCTRILYLDHGGLEALEADGEAVEAETLDAAVATLEPETPASIIYTSGTTGRPKGCVITHRNLLSECHALLDHPIGSMAQQGKRVLMFLPLAHVLARAVTYTVYLGDATVGFWDDTSTILPRFADFRPHMILGVPRVFEKVRDGIATKAAAKGAVQRGIFERAEAIAIENSQLRGDDGLNDARRPSLLHTAQYKALDLVVYKAIREALGGRCEYAISGGGALPDRISHFFRGVGVPIYEGYGLTESTAAATVNGPGCQRIGTVGRPVAGTSVRIADSGEVELAGELIFDRYWNNEKATAEAIRDGWFATGDIGSLDPDGYLTITGRAKEIIVTAGGKNVSPGQIEDAIRAHRLVGHAVLIGEARRFVSALITVDEAELENWAAENGHGGRSTGDLVTDPELRAEIQFVVDDANRQVSHAEGVKKFVVLPRDFTEDSGELTATLKVKRHVVAERYSEEIEGLYA
ncbi:long-chain fatty acid--CoA ligase [Dietzia sp. SLG310A2-38A2]|uniref:AMP-dependent synthetase/ligase n=1 Tax=Dietzia sp. SLG310A2-38A2 TaxID=1630643 RepID=UPI0015FCDAD6|nr:long-chain fatty acid--CoA ligase [Dietzia sp. SLG310A2-38A2]MBB1031163.1 long-chain fatty acid--CoA ligase [Dietzia sp. SLG310A2-38A2]